MKKKVGLFDVFILFTIVLALFFIIHFGGVILLRLTVGKKYTTDGEVSKKEAVLIATEYADIRNYFQLWPRYSIVSNVYVWKVTRDGDVWILRTWGYYKPVTGYHWYIIMINSESGNIILSRFSKTPWQIMIH